jgi:hypothetical protein
MRGTNVGYKSLILESSTFSCRKAIEKIRFKTEAAMRTWDQLSAKPTFKTWIIVLRRGEVGLIKR